MSVLDTILDYLPGSKIGRQIIAESAESKLAKRRELVDEIAQSEARLPAELPPLDAAVKAAEKEEAKTAAAAKKAHYEAAAARFARSRLPTSITARCDQLRAELRDTASPRIRTFDRELDRLFDEARQIPLVSTERETGKRVLDVFHVLVPEIGQFDNSASRKARLAAILAARRANQEFVYAAMAEEELQAAQEKLLAGLPSGTELAQI